MENINKINVKDDYNKEYFIKLSKSIIYTVIGIIIFFIPIKLNGQVLTLIYHISYKLQSNMKHFIEVCIVFYLIIGMFKEILKGNLKNKSILMISKIVALIFLVNIFFGSKNGLLGNDNVYLLIEEVVLDTITVFTIGVLFMPFLEYGLLELTSVYLNKYTKVLFRINGISFLNILVYIFTNPFCGMFMTNKLYREGKLKEYEACNIILNFSILSYPIVIYICEYLNINLIYAITVSTTVLILMNMILSRIYPISNRKKSYYLKSNKKNSYPKKDKLKKTMKHYLSNSENKNIFKEIIDNLEETISISINLIPNIVIFLYIGQIILNSEIIIEIIKILINPVLNALQVKNINELLGFIIDVFYNTIIGINNIDKSISIQTKILICIIGILSCTSISTNILYIVNSKMTLKINIKEFTISYLLRINLIIIIYIFIAYLYSGYLI